MKDKSIILNIIIIILECIGLYNCLELGTKMFLLYTVLSNIILLISSIYYVYTKLRNKNIKNAIIFRYISTICTTLTLLVVIFILVPLQNNIDILYKG